MGSGQSAKVKLAKLELERQVQLREVEGRLFQSIGLSSLTATERRVIDNQSTTLHRAAAHGDPHVLKTVLTEKGHKAIQVRDGQRRTALHVAAYCGNYEAFQTFISQDQTVEVLMARDSTNRTAFEVLAQSSKSSRLYSNNVAYELCEETETQRNIHRFSAVHFRACHLWFLYLPNVIMLALCAILSFVSATDSYGQEQQSQLSHGVIVFALICALLQTTAGVFRLDVRAAEHESCAVVLRELCKELNYTAVEEYVHDVEGQGEMPNAALIKKKLMQATAACKSKPPVALVELFYSLRTRVDHELCRVLRFDKNDERTRENFFLLKNIAYQRAQIEVTESLGWPFLMPWPKYAVKKILRKVAAAGKDEDGDGVLDDIYAADSDDESESDPEFSESDDEYDDEKRCLRACMKKKKNKNKNKNKNTKSKPGDKKAKKASGKQQKALGKKRGGKNDKMLAASSGKGKGAPAGGKAASSPKKKRPAPREFR